MTRPRMMISIAGFALLLITLAACGGDTASNPLPTGTPNVAQAQPSDTAMALATSTSADLQPAATVTVVSPTATPNYPPAAAAAVTAAKDHLGKMVGIPADQISVVSVTSTVFTENGLACPAQMGIAKLNIPGYTIILKIKNNLFEYHTSQDASIVRNCTSGTGSTGSGAGMGAAAGAGSGTGSGAGAAATGTP